MNKNILTDHGGFIVILLAAALMITICGIAGLAIDVGHAYSVKGEVQNAADAAALAGAGMFKHPLPSEPEVEAAKLTAAAFVQKNMAAGTNLTAGDAQIEAGYWDLDAKEMRSGPIYSCAGTVPRTPCTPGGSNPPGCVCEQRGVAAVRVTVQKTVDSHFAKVLGWTSFTPSAIGVAARGYPTTAKVGFPLAFTKCMTEYYMANDMYDKTIDIPKDFVIPGCKTGNWSSLNLVDNSNNSVKDLLTGKTGPVSVGIGESIMAQQGTRADLYQITQSQYINQTVMIPVVADRLLEPQTISNVTGFMAFTITGVQSTGEPKYITGKFNQYYEDYNAGGIGGSPSNTLSPPVLIK